MTEITYKSLVYDKEMVELFYNRVLGNLSPFEANFLSIASRNKYLKENEKNSIRLGHTCMMGKTIVRKNDSKVYLNKVLRLDAESNFYTDYDGNYLPRHTMVLYANINPTSTVKAAYEFKKIMAGYDEEAFQLAISKNPNRFDNLFHRYGKLYNNLMTCYQTQRSKKRWIDIDCDVKDFDIDELFNEVKDFCSFNEKFENVHPIGVATQGGLHILLNTDGLKDNPDKIVKFMQTYLKAYGKDFKEIIINKNEMIPLPGTFQNEFKVRMME